MCCVHPLSAPQHVAAVGPGGCGRIQDRQRAPAAPGDTADLWDPVGCPWSLHWLPVGCVIRYCRAAALHCTASQIYGMTLGLLLKVRPPPKIPQCMYAVSEGQEDTGAAGKHTGLCTWGIGAVREKYFSLQ